MDASVDIYGYGGVRNVYDTTQPPYTTTVTDQIQTFEKRRSFFVEIQKIFCGL